jgi:hypothetical protein
VPSVDFPFNNFPNFSNGNLETLLVESPIVLCFSFREDQRYEDFTRSASQLLQAHSLIER